MQQQQRQQAQHLGLARHEPVQQPVQRHRLRREVPARRGTPGAGQIALVEHQVDHCEHLVEPVTQLVRLGHPDRDAGFPRAFRARVSRWAIAGSAARNAAEISAVVSPQTARRVRAICESVGSAGWQQAKIRPSSSSAFSARRHPPGLAGLRGGRSLR